MRGDCGASVFFFDAEQLIGFEEQRTLTWRSSVSASRKQLTCLMHRRTTELVTLTTLPKLQRSLQRASTRTFSCRYRIRLACSGNPGQWDRRTCADSKDGAIARPVNQACQRFFRNRTTLGERPWTAVRTHRIGIAPDVIRRELDAPRRHSRSFVKASFMPHFSLYQPYF